MQADEPVMPAVIQCTQCQRQLNVLEAHLGALVRCPVCKTMFTAVAVGGARPPVAAPAPSAAPPLSPKTAPTMPGSAPMAAYVPPGAAPPVAAYAPPAMATFAPPPVTPGMPPIGEPVDEQDPFWENEPPPPTGPSRSEVYHSEFDEDEGVAQRAVRRHRGPIVMGLGVAGLVMFCAFPLGWILGGIAVALAAGDLQEMSRGRMDRAGRAQTQIGRYCGIAATILATLVCLLWIFRLVVTTKINA
jgi:hypothetical protein